ncbi:MAG: PepSY domain-containing protein [Xanthomonadaceae bacterium]|nr:PepSY domain-containing protein [Xanthomonadaceae bacterium]
MNIRFNQVAMALLVAVAGSAAMDTAMAQAAPARTEAAPRTLSLDQIERIASKEIGGQVVELEVEGLTVEAEGYDAQGRKVEVLLDRRDGSVLSRKVKVPKHMRGSAAAGTAPAIR